MIHYMSVLSAINNSLIKNYVYTLLNDGLRHVEYISSMMSNIEGASSSSNLTKNGLSSSIEEEKHSKNLLIQCLEMAKDTVTKSMLKSIVVDEEHHIRILEHIAELVESYN